MLSKFTGDGSFGNAFLNISTYCGIEFSVFSTSPGLFAISTLA